VLEVDTQHRDPGMFGPDSEAWRFDREAMLLLGAGPRALLLQAGASIGRRRCR
jgi:uncharacterized protein (DUF2236 family)